MSTETEIFDKQVDRAFLFQELGRHSEAIKAFKEVLRFNMDNYIAWERMGYSYLHLKQLELAEQAIQKALSLAPNNVDALLYQAMIYIAKSEFEEAESILLDNLKKYPTNTETLSLLGELYFTQGALKKATKFADLGLQVDPRNRSLLKLRMQILAMNNEFGKFQTRVDDYLSDDPTDGSVLSYKALLFIEEGKFKAAEDIVLQVLSKDPTDKMAKYILLMVYKNKNKFLTFFVGNAFNQYQINWNWRTILMFIIAMKGVLLWGGFFIIYMLITWVGGVLFNSYARLDSKLNMMLLPQDIKQSNFFLIGLGVLLLTTILHSFVDHFAISKLLAFEILALFIGISFFEVTKRGKRIAFGISSLLLFGLLFLLATDPLTLLFVGALVLILHGILFTFRWIA